jgi:hypothetical protein
MVIGSKLLGSALARTEKRALKVIGKIPYFFNFEIIKESGTKFFLRVF